MAYVSDKTLYHDGNGNVFEAAGKGRELLVRKGGELSVADAARFRLIDPPKRKASKPGKDAPAYAQPAAAQPPKEAN